MNLGADIVGEMEAATLKSVVENSTAEIRPFSTEWFVSLKYPLELWEDNWFALTLEIVSAALLFQVFRYAKKTSTHSTYLLLAALTATIGFEVLPTLPRPGYQLWWYHQGFVNILEQRVPSYVVCIYTLVHYLAHNFTSQSNLPPLTRSFVTAVSSTLIAFPFLWLAPRLLLILFHFDDPIFRDRILGIPYIQLVLLTLLFFHTSHLFEQNYEEIEPQERNTFNFVKCSLMSGIVAAMYSIVEQYLLYILITLILKQNTVVCFLGAMAVLAYFVKDELKARQFTSVSFHGVWAPLKRKEWWIVVSVFLFTSGLPLFLNVEDLKSTGTRLELGPCEVIHEVSNTSPLEIPRRRYVCPSDASHLNFDFHCVSQKALAYGVKKIAKQYTICGKAFENPVAMTKNFALYNAVCLLFFHVIMLASFTFKIPSKTIPENYKKLQ